MLGFLGGTFDPVHRGHVALGQWLYETGAFAAIHYVVNDVPPHRPAPIASCAQRLRMLELALEGCSGLYADDRELHRSGTSYTKDTLATVRAEVGWQQPLALIMGEDAFATLPSWRGWQELPKLAHLIVLRRAPGATSEDATHAAPTAAELATLEATVVLATLSLPQVLEPASLMDAPAGMIWCACQPLNPQAATPIRTKMQHSSNDSGPAVTEELPPLVAKYIKTEELYKI